MEKYYKLGQYSEEELKEWKQFLSEEWMNPTIRKNHVPG